MKTLAILCCSAAFGLAPIAHAETAAMDGETLGKLSAILDFCARVDPGDASKYKEWKKVVLEDGLTGPQRAKLTASDEYKSAYQMIDERLVQVAKADGRAACDDFMPSGKAHPGKGGSGRGDGYRPAGGDHDN